MAWTIRATCDKCDWMIPKSGPYESLYSMDRGTLDLSSLRDAMREHEVYEHGGKV